MGFIAVQPAPQQERPITNGEFWPDIDPANAREVMRLDGTVTLPRLRAALVEAMAFVNGQLKEWRVSQQVQGTTTLEDVPGEEIDGQNVFVQRYVRAVYCHASAILQEREKNFDATGHQDKAATLKRTDSMADDLRREAQWAIKDILQETRAGVYLI